MGVEPAGVKQGIARGAQGAAHEQGHARNFKRQRLVAGDKLVLVNLAGQTG